MAFAISLLLLVITLVATGLFAAHLWWLPHAISAIGPAIDRQFAWTFAARAVIFVSAQLALATLIVVYRDRRNRASRANTSQSWPEAWWCVACAVVFFGLNLMGYRIWARVHFTGAAPGAIRIEVWGEQFQWYFRYPGPDGQFGPVHSALINDSTGNYLGLDPTHDPASRDDIVTATLAVPVNRPVVLILRSMDVGHAFFVRELRLKQDLVPGMEIPVHFTAQQTGRFEIVCSQLCGLGHYDMRAFLQVMPQADFEKWLASQAANQ